MGEILRAICDANAITATPAFVTARIPNQSTLQGGARTFIRRSAVVELKADCWFLMMAWTIDAAIGSTEPLYQQKTFPVQFQIVDLANSRVLSQKLMMHSNAGYNLNNIVPLPHYTLWEPAAMIGFNADVPFTNPTATVQTETTITLAGIEYQFPAGRFDPGAPMGELELSRIARRAF